MFKVADIESLTHFQRNAKALIRQLKRSGRPKILTVQGKAEVVIQDAESYQALLDVVDRVESIEGVRRGLASAKRGRGRRADAVLSDVRARLGLD
jgi:PHD/YefM family antitoxin component YafN of YafNO toxin-antitoxin module